MEAEKYRNLADDELALEAQKTAEQLFRLRFQMKLGQTEGVKKLRELRRDIARIQTVERERELGLRGATHKTESTPAAKPAKKKSAKPARKKAAKKSATSRKGAGRTGARKSAAKPSANKKKAARSASVKKG